MTSSTSSTAANRRQEIITQPIGPTLIKLTTPMLLALLATIGLGFVDSYFISFLGTKELAAIGFIMPITMLMASPALGLGMAVSSLSSKLIGAKRFNSTARLITDNLYLTLVFSILLSGLLAWQLVPIFKLLGADSETMPFVLEYMQTWLVACVFLMLIQVFSSTFRAIGDTKTSAMISIVLTVINLCLSPLLIFGIGPFPQMGMQGAALATVIAVCSAVIIALYYLGVKERLILLETAKWQALKANLSALLNIAIPAMLANAIVPIIAAVMTALVAQYGAPAVAGFGVGVRIEAISLIVVYAMSATLPMFIGQNIGAGNKTRVADAIRISFKFIFVFQLIIYVVLVCFANTIAALFSSDSVVQETITHFLWIIPISYGFSSMAIITNVIVNVLGKPNFALYINLTRLIFIYFPLAYIGSQIHDLKGLFLGLSIGNLIAFLLAYIMLKKALSELQISLKMTSTVR